MAMRCPHCNAATAINQIYCQVCGGELQLSFEKVAKATVSELGREAELRTLARIEYLLSLAVLAFFLFGGLALALRPGELATRPLTPVFPGDDAVPPLPPAAEPGASDPRGTLLPYDGARFRVDPVPPFPDDAATP